MSDWDGYNADISSRAYVNLGSNRQDRGIQHQHDHHTKSALNTSPSPGVSDSSIRVVILDRLYLHLKYHKAPYVVENIDILDHFLVTGTPPRQDAFQHSSDPAVGYQRQARAFFND